MILIAGSVDPVARVQVLLLIEPEELVTRAGVTVIFGITGLEVPVLVSCTGGVTSIFGFQLSRSLVASNSEVTTHISLVSSVRDPLAHVTLRV